MGLTASSTGRGAADAGLSLHQLKPECKVIALAGNPNVGKSTVFNALTGMNQHTGNWPGKTVSSAQGHCTHNGREYLLVDIPGTYSLMAHSAEEEVARDFICFGQDGRAPDAVVVVCDATCLERNLNLVLQTLEITANVVVCVNLMDEARKRGVQVDLPRLSAALGVPVVGTSARSEKGLDALMDAVEKSTASVPNRRHNLRYGDAVEEAVRIAEPAVSRVVDGEQRSRWVTLQLLLGDKSLADAIGTFFGVPLHRQEGIATALEEARQSLWNHGIHAEKLQDEVVSAIMSRAEKICRHVVSSRENCNDRDRKLDRILTSKRTGIPLMLLLLLGVFWLTITGANYPSQWLADGLFWIQDRLTEVFQAAGAPEWLHGALVLGVYRVLAWVVSVMLPPMAIFFPLFTLLEDFGYLPRVAFNLDKYFKKACACGKQALTMCMGFGCNAAGVVGCRIIDSPRERLIATITNVFVPCNGRFPTLIAILTMFFIGTAGGFGSSVLSALGLTIIIVFGVMMTLLISKILSKTILKGMPSSFTLELPPYRRPQIGKVIVRSVFDRTLFVLGRAAAVAAPAGLIIWLLANITVGDISVLQHCADFLDPFGRLLGMDGVILMAFILGFPANEIVVPIIIMTYMATGTLTDMSNLAELHTLLTNNGWTWLTAVCTMLFSLMHWPCSTTCVTIRKETQSIKWTAVSFLVPTIAGMLICFVTASAVRLLGLV